MIYKKRDENQLNLFFFFLLISSKFVQSLENKTNEAEAALRFKKKVKKKKRYIDAARGGGLCTGRFFPPKLGAAAYCAIRAHCVWLVVAGETAGPRKAEVGREESGRCRWSTSSRCL